MRRGDTEALAKTIYAVSSAPGRGAIAIIRVSGPNALGALRILTGREVFVPRRAHLVHLIGADGHAFDQALVLWFPGPQSATGEDMVEFHVHGGPAVIGQLFGVLGSLEGFALAEPGAFTRRAFDHGRLDLTQAEGLADLINAETASQARQALQQLDGALGRLYENWRQGILRALALAEAVLDFPDEDVPDQAALESKPGLARLAEAIRSHLADGGRGEILRDGVQVVLLGAPNAGKSTLLNALARRDVAIVSATPGTTRDVLEVRLDLEGMALIVADTAGLRAPLDAVEGEGIRRAKARAVSAHIRLALVDSTAYPSQEVLDALSPGDLVVFTKADLGADVPRISGFDTVTISAKTGEGLDRMTQWLAGRAQELVGGPDVGVSGAAVLTRARHREALTEALASLDRALEMLGQQLDLGAEDLRLAARAIGRITGRVDVEDVLTLVFREFCIGK